MSECNFVEPLKSWVLSGGVMFEDMVKNVNVSLPEGLGTVPFGKVLLEHVSTQLNQLLTSPLPVEFAKRYRVVRIPEVYVFAVPPDFSSVFYSSYNVTPIASLVKFAGLNTGCVNPNNSLLAVPYMFQRSILYIAPFNQTTALLGILGFMSEGEPTPLVRVMKYIADKSKGGTMKFKDFKRLIEISGFFRYIIYFNPQGITSTPFPEFLDELLRVVFA